MKRGATRKRRRISFFFSTKAQTEEDMEENKKNFAAARFSVSFFRPS